MNSWKLAAVLAVLAAFSVHDAAGSSEGLEQSSRRLLAAPPPHKHAPGPAHGHGKGFLYSEKDGPLAFTISAKNSTAESKNHAAGKNTAHSECEIQGASPKSKHPDDFRKGPLDVAVPTGSKSVITLNSLKGITYKMANMTGSTNVTTVTPSTTAPTTLTFAPNYHTLHTDINLGVYSSSSSTASCTLTVRFHALHSAAHTTHTPPTNKSPPPATG